MSSNNEYAKLKKVWYKKLAKSGFEDIETNKEKLKVWSNRFTQQKSVDSREAKEQYYHMATSFLNSYKFSSQIEKIIWEYHTEGISGRDIAKILKKTKVFKSNRQTIWLMIKHLKNEMKKMYMPSYWENNEQF